MEHLFPTSGDRLTEEVGVLPVLVCISRGTRSRRDLGGEGGAAWPLRVRVVQWEVIGDGRRETCHATTMCGFFLSERELVPFAAIVHRDA